MVCGIAGGSRPQISSRPLTGVRSTPTNSPPSDSQLALVIAGPTAVGKTDLAIELAAQFDCALISVDSAMVYRGMDIGTAKPDAATLARTPHALVDIREPEDSYSAGDFVYDAEREMAAAWAVGKTPLLVGGTLLYIKALHGGLADLPAANPAVRASIDAAARVRGWPALHAELALHDPVTAARLAPNDAQRIQRALEVCRLTGKALSALQADKRAAPPSWRTLAFGLVPADRAVLHQRIHARFDAMLDAGFLAEVERLAARPGLETDSPAMRAVGYRQLLPVVAGDESLATAVPAARAATRQLAKRQLTWLRHDPLYRRVDPLEKSPIDTISRVLERALG